ncbi:class I SAM-dependent methyltransferase [Hyphomonas sp. UBA5107]|jgi:SAM-dependent methyltransferase|uniref:class I SAM-dependent methyltransferase n=1 Tax=Hyphomonas sp. UBA5107 TaxID=1946636 RepID=UPI000C4D31F3|nr:MULTISPECIES: class I SAM-dependent methyltransferase [unclassified Hyphomonas]MAA82993.1 methylase [Hyphomonas sp.]HCN91956.1 class I SAM-dependent methyltransferase [Hyphomonas sp.]|tara:strand:+ start:403 stop:1113 length:711 start_codon:yes stop_codon:yes gene_type:complete
MEIKNSEIARTFDEHEAEYSNTVNDALNFSGLDVDFFTKVKADYIGDLVKSHFGKTSDAQMLDIGCGVGNFHPLLLSRFARIDGVDISPSSIERAQSNNPGVNYQCYDGDRLPFDDDTFDVAITVCVMHHVPPASWPSFAREMHRVVRPGGLALVFEHNPVNPLAVHVVNNCPFDADAVLLRAPKTKALLSGAGFEDVVARSIITIPPFNAFFRGIDRLFSRLPLGAQYYVAAKKS